MEFIYRNEDFKKLFNESPIIVMDTNVILGLYSFTSETIEDIINSFEEYQKFFWLPNQVYLEYVKRYEQIRKRESNRFQNLKEEICKALSDTIGVVSKKYNAYNKYKLPEVDDSRDRLVENINNAIKIAKQDLEKLQEEHSEQISCISEQNDTVYNFVDNIKKSSNANGFSMLELIDIYEEGEKRYKYKMPPGFTDIEKPDKSEEYSDFIMRKYGDLIIWKEILKKIKGKDVKLIFVENEVKEDWWTYKKSRPTRIPKILEEEFFTEAGSNSEFYMVTFDELISHFGNYLNIQPTSILEVTKRMDFVRKMEAYLESNQFDIAKDYIEDKVIDNLASDIYDILIGKGFMTGSIDDVEDIEILDITVEESSFNYDENECEVIINAKVTVESAETITSYLSREVSSSVSVTTTFSVEIELYLNIDNEKEVEKAIEYDTVDFDCFKLMSIDYDEDEVSMSFSDDD